MLPWTEHVTTLLDAFSQIQSVVASFGAQCEN